MHYFPKVTLATSALLVLSALPGQSATFTGSLNDGVPKFSPGASVADIINSGAASVSFGDTRIYIGTYQKNSIDQDPIIASITNGALDWIRADYDQSSPDGRGEGLVWDTDNNNLYGVFTITGGSNQSVNKFTGFTTSDSWLRGYGSGGGASVSVLLKLNPENGAGMVGNATYIRSQLKSGKTNTLKPIGLELSEHYISFLGTSAFRPLDARGKIIGGGDPNPGIPDDSPSSPFPYRAIFDLGLTTACNTETILVAEENPDNDGIAETVSAFTPISQLTQADLFDDPACANILSDSDNGSGGGDGGDGGDGGSGGGDGGDGGSGGGDGDSGGGDGGSGGGDGGSGGGDGGSGGGDPQSVPEPGMVVGTMVAFGASALLKKRQG